MEINPVQDSTPEQVGGKIQDKKIGVIVNGKPTEISAGTSLQKLLEDLKLKPQLVAVELNEKILRRQAYPATILSEGDRVEILQMIGGG